MADTGIFATTTEVQRKIGANANSTANAEAYINDFISQAESIINAETRYNWSDVYTTLNADVKGLLKEAASNLAAIYVLNYDLSGTGLRELETRLDVLYERYEKAIKLLQDYKVKDFVSGA